MGNALIYEHDLDSPEEETENRDSFVYSPRVLMGFSCGSDCNIYVRLSWLKYKLRSAGYSLADWPVGGSPTERRLGRLSPKQRIV